MCVCVRTVCAHIYSVFSVYAMRVQCVHASVGLCAWYLCMWAECVHGICACVQSMCSVCACARAYAYCKHKVCARVHNVGTACMYAVCMHVCAVCVIIYRRVICKTLYTYMQRKNDIFPKVNDC